MHIIHSIGIDRIIENTMRVKSVLEGEVPNPMPQDLCEIRSRMIERYDNAFVNDLMTMFERMTGKTFPKRDSLYHMLAQEPFIGIVQLNNTNDSNYPCNIPLIVGTTGPDGLYMPDGTRGNAIGRDIRLATEEELLHYAGLAK